MSSLLRMPTPPWQVTPLHPPDGLISSAFHIGDAMLQGNLMRSTLQRVEFQPLRGFPCLKLEPLRGINLVDRPPFSRVLFKVQNPCLLTFCAMVIHPNLEKWLSHHEFQGLMGPKVGEAQIKDSKNWNFRRDKPIYERFQLVFPQRLCNLPSVHCWNTAGCILNLKRHIPLGLISPSAQTLAPRKLDILNPPKKWRFGSNEHLLFHWTIF